MLIERLHLKKRIKHDCDTVLIYEMRETAVAGFEGKRVLEE
jgi:CRISPR/Cas system-associated endoribonuclease Cas2